MIRKFGGAIGVDSQPLGLDIGLSGSNIKSIQRGSFVYSNKTTFNVTISSVDMSKSIVIVSTDSRTGSAGKNSVVGNLTTSTNINFSTYYADASFNNYVSWQVIEFNNVKSLQRGTQALITTDTTKNITISAVNDLKSIVFASVRTDDNSNNYSSENSICAEITTTTNILFTRYNPFATNATIYWQVIEFN